MKKLSILVLFLTIIVAMVVVYGLSGCKSTTEEPAEEVTEEPAEEVTEEPAEEKLEFVALAKGIHPFYDPGGEGMKDAAEEIGGINVRYMAPSEWSGEAQMKMMENLIAEGVDGIAVAVYEAGSLTSVINEATNRGIPVVTWDDDAKDSDRIVFIGTNNVESGKTQGEFFVEMMGEEANFIIWVQDLSARTVLERAQGIRSVTDKYPNMVELREELLSTMEIGPAIPKAETLLDTFPELDATLDTGPMGTTAMIRMMKEREIAGDAITLLCWDANCSPELIEGIKEGYVEVSMVQNPYAMGYLSAYALKWCMEGKRPTKESIDSGILKVTKNNVDEMEELSKKATNDLFEEFKQYWE